MRVGTVCYATAQGLGVLAKAFYDHGVITDPVIVRHGSRPTHPEWYPPGTPSVGGDEIRAAVGRMLDRVDAMLFFETPFRWELIADCRAKGVASVLMPMYECMPRVLPLHPDLILNPSALDQRHYPEGVQVTVPVTAATWRPRGDAVRTFVHNAGHGGLRGRNGTAELIEAWPHVSPDARLILRSQENLTVEQTRALRKCGNVDIRIGTAPHAQLYMEGQAFVFPEKFNGLSLPLQEAHAAGMVVVATDRFPNNTWLPKGPLVRSVASRPASISPRLMSFSEAVVDPEDIALKINSLLGTDPSEYGNAGRDWGRANDWAVWGPKYRGIIADAVNKRRASR